VTYLLDTNVVSEAVKPKPSRAVLTWLAEVDEDRVFLSTITIAEVRRGIALAAAGKRRDALERWLRDDLVERFAGRLIPIDVAVAEAWGDLMGESRRRGTALSVMDGFLAATARARSLTLVTRNVADFAPLGLMLLDPWDAA
jgi:toxin FitB